MDTSNKKTAPVYVDNAEWLTKLKYIQFLETLVVTLLSIKCYFDSVKLRLDREQSLSYMEFNYDFTSYDFINYTKIIIVFCKLEVQTNGKYC